MSTTPNPTAAGPVAAQNPLATSIKARLPDDSKVSTNPEFDAVIASMPQFRCHKVVRAAHIIDIHPASATGVTALELETETGKPHHFLEVGLEWLKKFSPEVGQVLVAYDDGYISVSPMVVFMDGYSLLTDEPETATGTGVTTGATAIPPTPAGSAAVILQPATGSGATAAQPIVHTSPNSGPVTVGAFGHPFFDRSTGDIICAAAVGSLERLPQPGAGYRLRLEESGMPEIRVPFIWFAQNNPVPGGMAYRRQDGILQYSEPNAFNLTFAPGNPPAKIQPPAAVAAAVPPPAAPTPIPMSAPVPPIAPVLPLESFSSSSSHSSSSHGGESSSTLPASETIDLKAAGLPTVAAPPAETLPLVDPERPQAGDEGTTQRHQD